MKQNKTELEEADRGEAERKAHQWKVAQLAATLATRYPLKLDSYDDIVANKWHPDYREEGEDCVELDPFYLSLVNRAETLLAMAGGEWGKVPACNLFEDGRYYSQREIAQTMKKVGWPGMGSPGSVKKFLTKFFSFIDKEIEEEETEIKEYKDKDPIILLRRHELDLMKKKRSSFQKDQSAEKNGAYRIFKEALRYPHQFGHYVYVERSKLSLSYRRTF